ncbi:Bug family tripartite tricarboxylate transporter substrate binding protein [Propionivibrio soli]|uniref:Bug family tripartite tricarboxylate transporter substrate binding protein n=1 Tax=Propionivibrio soli TaxID=2976531 RepID=UPI0021E85095|nr:tripartite tricarboxylate transporter substrate binding protein [Propionivibrio soli]
MSHKAKRTAMTVLFASLAIASGSTLAQADYPNKPIRLIVPFPAGGGTDIFARVISNKLSERLKWVVIVDNKPGAGGNIGVDAAAKSPADGYTIVLGQTSNLAINPTLYKKLPYDPLKDLVPIVLVADSPLTLVVPAQSSYKTIKEFVAAAKQKPGDISLGSPGNGTVAHLTIEMFQSASGTKYQHIPYKGAAQAITDLMGGSTDSYMSSVTTAIGHIKGGKLRALAVTGKKRVDSMPDVPTIDEAGYQGFDASTWFGLLAPAGTPPAIVERINTEVNKILVLPDVKEKIAVEGGGPLGGTSQDFARFLATELPKWARLVKESGAKID